MPVWMIPLLLILAACATAAPQAAPTTIPPTAAPAQPTAVPPTAQPAPPADARPAWQTLPLTDARTGQTFTLADFAGKTVFVEPMATWCSNCRAQLGAVRAAREALNTDQVVFVALSVETDLTAAALAEYAEDNGFDWMFAVLTPELLGELVAAFGRSASNPPATPHFIIRPDGTATGLSTGQESADELVSQLQAEGGL